MAKGNVEQTMKTMHNPDIFTRVDSNRIETTNHVDRIKLHFNNEILSNNVANNSSFGKGN